MALLAVWDVLLLRYTGEEDVIVRPPASDRPREEQQDVVGFMANVVALRVSMQGGPTFGELLGRTARLVPTTSSF